MTGVAPEARGIEGTPEARGIEGTPEARGIEGTPEARGIEGTPEARRIGSGPEARIPATRCAPFRPCRPESAAPTMTLVRIPG